MKTKKSNQFQPLVVSKIYLVVANEWEDDEIYFVGYAARDAKRFIKNYDGDCQLMVTEHDV